MANTNTRLTANMSVQDMLITMCDGNPGALTCMMEMIQDDSMTGMMDIMLFDKLGIYGSKIYMVWNDCCGRDMEKFTETIRAFREGKFTEEEIHKNLSLPYAKPFIWFPIRANPFEGGYYYSLPLSLYYTIHIIRDYNLWVLHFRLPRKK